MCDNTRDDRIALLAYWQILRSTDRIVGKGARTLTASDLRIVAGRPASLGDVLEAWITTKPRAADPAPVNGGALGALMSHAGDPAKVRRLFGG